MAEVSGIQNSNTREYAVQRKWYKAGKSVIRQMSGLSLSRDSGKARKHIVVRAKVARECGNMTVFTTLNMQVLIISKREEVLREDKCIVTYYDYIKSAS
jgi:hypothetical protein